MSRNDPERPGSVTGFNFFEMIRNNKDVKDLKDIREIVLEGLAGSAKEKAANHEGLRAIEQRIKELETRQTE